MSSARYFCADFGPPTVPPRSQQIRMDSSHALQSPSPKEGLEEPLLPCVNCENHEPEYLEALRAGKRRATKKHTLFMVAMVLWWVLHTPKHTCA